MRKTLLFVVLILGMCSINGSAQNKKDIDCDSVRVLEWKQCSACWGSGNCPVCKNYGKRYEGTKLTMCQECLGDGRCHQCFGKGGDHYYVWKHSVSKKSATVSATDDANQFVTITDGEIKGTGDKIKR